MIAARPFLLAALALTAAGVHAQVQIPPGADPAVIQQREIERERREREERERRERIERPLKPPAKPPAPPPTGEELRFFVREIEFWPPSEILTKEELEALAAPYRGRTLGFAELRELVAKVNELYRAKGVVTAQAVLPPQEVSDGIVRIRLIEGRVGRIRLEGNETTDADYVTNRLRLKPSMLVDLVRLESDLIRFNRSNDAQLRAELRPGERFGETDIALTLSEPKRDDARLFLDNSGSPPTGELRVGAAWLHRSLTGRRDDLYASVVEADGHHGRYLTYGLPVNTWGTRLNFGWFNDRTKIKHGPIAALRISGEASALQASLRHPIAALRAAQLDGLLTLRKRHTVNFIDTTLLNAADLYSATAGLELQVPDDRGYWVWSADRVSGRNAPLGADRRSYRVWRGSVRRSMALDPAFGWTFVGGLAWQYTEDELLPPAEQHIIGGEASVRGFTNGLLSGDRGMTVNLEFHRPVPLPETSAWKAAGYLFFDYGETRPFRPPGNTRSSDVITSVGGGMNFSRGKNASGRIVLGLPTKNREPEEPRNYRIHFQFVWHLL
jgi:hemolysin activation/secretion protein